MGTSAFESLTSRPRWRSNLAFALLAVASVARADGSPEWPAFLPPRDSVAPGLAWTIDRILEDATFTRTVNGGTVDVPYEVYLAFVDAPEVTAAAARHLGLAHYDVRPLDDGWYEADDHTGARGLYKVVERTPTRRVILSWGSHHGSFLGTVSGSALSVLEFENRGRETGERLTAYVVIDNRAAAALARALVPVFGALVDRKLTEGFRVTAKVARWATRHPEEFCQWLGSEGLTSDREVQLLQPVADCIASAIRQPGA